MRWGGVGAVGRGFRVTLHVGVAEVDVVEFKRSRRHFVRLAGVSDKSQKPDDGRSIGSSA